MSLGNLDDFNMPSSYFKPKEHRDDVCIIMEPVDFIPDKPGGYKDRVRDVIVCNIWTFNTMLSLEVADPSEYYARAELDSAALVRRGKAVLDSPVRAVPFTLEKEDTRGGNQAWVPHTPTSNVQQLAGKFWEAKEKAEADVDLDAALDD